MGSGSRMTCTSFSHSGYMYMSMKAMRPQQSSHFVSSASPSPGSATARVVASYPVAVMRVASTTACSSFFSPSMFWCMARTAAAGVIALIGRYLSRPTRATNSWNSENESSAISSVAEA